VCCKSGEEFSPKGGGENTIKKRGLWPPLFSKVIVNTLRKSLASRRWNKKSCSVILCRLSYAGYLQYFLPRPSGGALSRSKVSKVRAEESLGSDFIEMAVSRREDSLLANSAQQIDNANRDGNNQITRPSSAFGRGNQDRHPRDCGYREPDEYTKR